MGVLGLITDLGPVFVLDIGVDLYIGVVEGIPAVFAATGDPETFLRFDVDVV